MNVVKELNNLSEKMTGEKGTATTDAGAVKFIADNYQGGGGTPYVLPKASASTLGGIKVGENLSIDNDGVLSAQGGSSANPYLIEILATEEELTSGVAITGDASNVISTIFADYTGGELVNPILHLKASGSSEEFYDYYLTSSKIDTTTGEGENIYFSIFDPINASDNKIIHTYAIYKGEASTYYIRETQVTIS